MKLYEINEQIKGLLDEINEGEIDENGEIITNPTTMEMLDFLEISREEKIENLIRYYKNLNGDIAKFKEEEKTLAQRRKTLDNKIKWIKGTLDWEHKDKIKKAYGVHEIRFRKSSKVIGEDVEILPEDLKETRISPKRADIKKRLKDGESFEGWNIEEFKNIQIV